MTLENILEERPVEGLLLETPGLKNKKRMPSFAALISFRAYSRSCAAEVFTNHGVTLQPST